MRIRYGPYKHRIAECDLSITRRPVENALGTIVALDETWTISGRLYNLTGKRASMYGEIQNFEAAYAINNQDLILEYFDGTASYHQLLNRDCIGGTIVKEPPQFPTGKTGENNTIRTYRVVVTGRRPIGRSAYMAFSERITVSGGGARWGCIEVNRGEGVRQQLRTHTICRATQSGSATGLYSYITPPPPIWPYALVDQLPELTLESPETFGERESALQLNHTISWNYQFEATQRLFGTPHYLTGNG